MASELEKLRKKLGLDDERVKNSTPQTKSTNKTNSSTKASATTTTRTTSSNTSKTTSHLSQLRKDLGLDEQRTKNSTSQSIKNRLTVDDIAPVKKKKEDERKWFQKGVFEDGYQVGDISKAILGTLSDVGQDLTTGAVGMGEKALDALMTIAPYSLLSSDPYTTPAMREKQNEIFEKAKKDSSEFVKKDLYDEEAVSKQILSNVYGNFANTQKLQSGQFLTEDDLARGQANTKVAENYLNNQMETESVLGEKADSVVQSGGQLLGTMGLQAAGVPWYLTTGATAFGGEAENAFNEGATHEEALLSSTIAAGAEILTEKISGGIKFGGKALDDVLTQQIARGISNKFVRSAAKLGLDMFGEGAEEWITEDINKFGQWLTYRDEEELKELLFSEEAMDEKIEAFLGGAALGGVSNVSNVAKSKIEGVDSVSGLTQNEEAVVKKIYDDLVAEAKKDGKVTAREKTKIYDRVTRELEKGGISTDVIESLVDEEGYNAFTAEKDNFFNSGLKKSYDEAKLSEAAELDQLQKKLEELIDAPNTVGNNKLYDSVVSQITELTENPKSNAIKAQLDQEVKRINEMHNELRTKVHDMVKGTKLEESYNELIRSNQDYEVDLEKYTNPHARKTIENILKSGMGDNTNHFHEYADWLAQISADKGMSFSLTNNEALKGTEHDFSAEGLITNGYKTADGIVLNMDSPKALNSTVGHEITHVLEQNTELYQTLQDTVFKYEITKNGQEAFDKRLNDTIKRYKGKDADAKAELTADLIGDYLFTDYDFAHNLSVENRNIFEKIYDEIKYLYKVVTAGSKEARELEKVKKAFDDAYRANVKGKTDTKHSLGYHAGDLGKAESYAQQGGYRGTGHFGTGTYFVGNQKSIEGYNSRNGKPAPVETVEFDNYNLYKVYDDKKGLELHDNLRAIDAGFTQEFLDAAKANEMRVSKLREQAWEKADSYDTQVWDDALEMYVSGDYIGNSIRAYTEVAQESNIEAQSYDEWLEKESGEVISPEEDDYDFYKSDYLHYLKETIEEADAEKNDGYESFNDAYFKLWLRFGKDNVNNALQKVIEHDAAMEQGGYDVQKTADSRATVFMKALGYEGIDVRGTGLDNTKYGSVIYDLKGKDLDRKNEIGTAKYSLSDSTGKKLTKEQQDYFKDSKVRDENGNLKVMYHGSPESFTVFDKKKAKSSGYYGKGFYFTDSDSHAKQYGNTYETYLNITNPLQDGTTDITKDQLRKFVEAIAENEDYGIDNYGYGATVDSVTDSVYGKSDFAILMDINASCVGNMVEAIELFNEVNGTDYNGIIAPTETVAFYPEQIKRVDNLNPTKDKDIRFSLSEAVEETKDLMALHNLHSSELLKQLKMGGMAYPSIAITKPELFSHDGFGEVSVILHKDAIDPKKNKYNKIYSADAYTPTFPNVDYEASEQVATNITSKVNALYDKLPEYYQRSLRSLRDYTNIDDQLNRWGGEQRLVEKYADDYAMKQLYLAEKGEAVPVEKKSTETRMTDYQMKLYQTVADTFGEDVLKSFNEKGNFEKLGLARMAWLEKYGGALKDIYAADWSSDGTMTKEEALEIANEQKPIYWKGEIDRALDFIKTGGVTVTETDDIGSTQAKIDEKIAGSDYKQWVDNLFSGIEGQSGIRNSKDLFTPSGNRRSFAQTHDPLTIDNIVKAMRKENQTGQGAFGGGSILGASAKEFGSIAEVKKNSGKLGTMDKAEHDAITDRINDTFWDIARRYANGKDIIDAQEAIAEAVSKNESKAGIARYLKQYDYVYQYTDSIGDEIIELRDYIRSLPTPYFEAKPRRGVGFDEVAAFVIPNNADIKLKQELLNRGYNIAEYDPKVEGDRQRVVNQFEEFKFSLSNVGEKPKQYGDWNVYGNDFGYKGDFAPVIPSPNRKSVLPGERHSVSEMFPDEPDVSQAEYDNLVEVKESLENWMQELSGADLDNPEIFSEFEQVNEKLVEVYNRLLELDGELSDADRLDSLTDADAPPEMDAPYYESEPTTLTKKATADIVRDVRASLSLTNPEMADCKDIIERYRTGEIQTREELIEALQDKFGTFKDTEVNERLAEVKKAIRTTRINVSDTIKHGIADYAHVMRSMRGKMLFAKDGLAVDEVYKELQEQFPDFFNEDADMNPEDQLRHIIEIANAPHVTETEGTKDIGNIEEAADLIINGIGEFKQNQKLGLSNKESKQAFESLVRHGDKYAPMDDIAPVAKNATTTKVTVSNKESVAPVKSETQSGRVAQVHTVEPKTEKKKSKAWSWAKEHLLDNGMVFEDLSKKTGNRKLEAKWNFIRNSGARAQRLIGKGANGVKALTDIRKQVEKSGKTDKFFNYLYHVHNIDRMTLADRFTGTPNKAVFGDTVTADISKQEADRLLKQNPEFKQWSQDIYKFNKHLRKLLVDGGVISQEVANLWEKMYPHYVPIRRAGDNGLNINVPLDSNRTGVNAPIKRATGGSRDILPLFDTMAMRAEQTYRAIAKNNFGIELKNMLGSTIANEAQTVDGVIESLDSDEALLKPGENGTNPTFTVFENGERVEFEITKEMYEAMKPKSDITSATSKVLNGISNFRRGTLTEYNPWFLLKNAIKDQQDIIINSQHPVKTYANMPVAIAEMAADGEYYQEYLENGGEQNTYFDTESNTFNENKAWEAVKWATGLNEIAWANNKIEMLPRLAEYIASRKAGRSVEVSMLDAARVTTNFAAGGDVTKFANRNGVTFLNASVQGAVQQARNIREAKMNGLKGWAGLAARYLVAGLPAVLLNNLIWEDDEEYEELADYVKRDYYIVGKFGDGKFLRIPKGRTVAVLQNAFEQMDNLRTGDDDLDLKAFLELAVSNLAPNNPLENNVLSPIIQVAKNKTWYGEDLVPSRLQDVPAAEQYDESTDDISRWLGEKFDKSPVKINYLLDQYSGVIGDTFLPMLTPKAESGDDTAMGTMTAPLRDMFTTDSVINNQISGDFYDTKDLVDIAANSSKATDEDKMKSTYMQAVSWELSDLYAQKREIQNSDLADSAKYKQSRDIQKQINEIMENAMGGYEDVSIDGIYSEVGDKRFNYSAEKDTWYEIKPKNANGSDNWYYQKEQEVTKGLGISYGEYWNDREAYNFQYDNPEKYDFLQGLNISASEYLSFDEKTKSAYTWASKNPEAYAVSKAVASDVVTYRQYTSDLWDLKADKDENGKSISGSRKTKVIDYINNMDADYGEKIILFKSEYPADDDYNYDIISYLNSRNDISYQEMETILKQLGFNVDAKGNISW